MTNGKLMTPTGLAKVHKQHLVSLLGVRAPCTNDISFGGEWSPEHAGAMGCGFNMFQSYHVIEPASKSTVYSAHLPTRMCEYLPWHFIETSTWKNIWKQKTYRSPEKSWTLYLHPVQLPLQRTRFTSYTSIWNSMERWGWRGSVWSI